MRNDTAGTAQEVRLNWKVLLGLTGHDSGTWRQLHVARLSEVALYVPAICLTNLLSAAVLLAVLWNSAPAWQLIAWFGALCAVFALKQFRAIRSPERRPADDSVSALVLQNLIAGLLWAIPAAFFSLHASSEQQVAITLIVAGVLAGAPVTLFALPLAMFAFIVPAALGLTVMMTMNGSSVAILLPPIYALCLTAGGIVSGKAFLSRTVAERAFVEQNEVVRLLLRDFQDHSADWLWQIDVGKQLRDVSPRHAQAAGSTPEALEGMPLLQLLAGDSWQQGASISPEFGTLLNKINARESFSDLELPVVSNGEARWWRLSATPRLDISGQFAGFRGVGSDITGQRRSAERIDRMARFDSLTGLANRAHFTDTLRAKLEHGMQRGTRCALLLIDLDKFKAVNDSLGHPMGDKLLRVVSQRLCGLAGHADLCGRMGGDEFALLIADASDALRVDQLGESIVAAMSQPFLIEGQLLHIGASVGSAIGPRDGRSVDMLMRNADLALYRAKDQGRGQHCRFEPLFSARAERRRQVELALRAALAENQFSLMYQPVFGTHEGAIAGFEALLRWKHPELGEVSPAEFVPIAEEARLLGLIGEWVLQRACADAVTWTDNKRVSVNLASAQLYDTELPAMILKALEASGLQAWRLELEVGEEVFLRKDEVVVQALKRIQATGVQIALDDFGTGFSYVKDARFSTIKIARSFVHSAANNSQESVAIIRALVAMADTLGVMTTAKGAETPAEHALARRLGCRQVQGYLSGRPMTAEQAAALIVGPQERNVA